MEYQPYTYLIGWSKQDLWYYGSETGSVNKTANPRNLWTRYFTSSRIVKEYREHYGEPNVIEVRKIFDNKEQTIKWESLVLQRMKVAKSARWLNQHDNNGACIIGMLGKKHRPGSIAKIKANHARSGGAKTPEGRENVCRANRIVRLGKKQSTETIEKRILKNTGKKRSEEAKQRMRNAWNKRRQA